MTATPDLSYLRAQRWQRLTLPDLFERGGVDPDRAAIVFQGRTRSYGELRDRMRRVAHGLIGAGVAPLERVALLCRNRLEYFEIETGIAAACAIMVPMNWRLRPQELVAILRRATCAAIFVEGDLSATICELRRAGELPDLRTVIVLDGEGADLSYDRMIATATDTPLALAPQFDDPHEIIFTSGTTGRPKGVVWTNGGVMFNSLQQIVDFQITSNSVTHTSIDLYYIGGRHDLTWATLHAGGTVHIKESGGFVAEDVLRYVTEQRVTHVLWVPTMIYDLLRVPAPERFDTKHLRFIMSGGQPLSADVTRQVQARFPRSAFVQVYGLTEGGGSVTFVPDHALLAKPGSAGKPSLHAAIRIVDDDGHDLPPHTDGEIWVRAPSMTAGYWDDPDLTATMLKDDWLRTGDVGRLDEDGFLYVTGRKKDMIISGGMNIFPDEIEDVLRQHAAVADVAVIGTPHDKWGEQVCAIIELRRGMTVTEDEIVLFCSARLAGYKKPTAVILIDEMPRTATGKQQKFLLRERYAARAAVRRDL